MTVFFLFARWHNCFSTVVSQKWGAIMNVCTESIWLCCYAGVICLFKIILHNCCLNKQFVFWSLNCIFFQALHKHRHLLHGSRSIIPILSIGRPLPHPKIAPSRGGIRTPIQYMVTMDHPTTHAKRHLDRSSRFATIPARDQLTDRPWTSLAIGPGYQPLVGSLDLKSQKKYNVTYYFREIHVWQYEFY